MDIDINCNNMNIDTIQMHKIGFFIQCFRKWMVC